MKEPFDNDSSRLFVAGFARGYRAWSVRPEIDLALRSVSYVYSWLPGKNLAECQSFMYLRQLAGEREGQRCCDVCATLAKQRLREYEDEGHRAPSINSASCNTCGFYALHSPDPGDGGGYLTRGNAAYGSIKAQGNVVIGEKGFRAQIAEVEALAGKVAKASAGYYNVPWYPDLAALAVDYPPQEQTGHNHNDNDKRREHVATVDVQLPPGA
jgi:hypothetical protein